MKLLAKLGVLSLLLIYGALNVQAQQVCYGPYLLPGGRLINTCGSTVRTPTLNGFVMRTWAVAQNSSNSQVEKLVLGMRIWWKDQIGMCVPIIDEPRDCAFCTDTRAFWGESASTIYYPSGSWYEIARHRLRHNGAQNTTVTPPAAPKPFFTAASSFGFGSSFAKRWRGETAPSILQCQLPAGFPMEDDN